MSNKHGNEFKIFGLRCGSNRFCNRARRLLVALVLTVGTVGATYVALDQWLIPLPEELLHRPTATFVYSREGRLLTAYTSRDYFWRKPVSLNQISPKLISSVIATEDKHFYLHPGVNPFSLVKAAVANIRAGRTVRGGSTITMQIARMIEPKARTVVNKLFEIFRAIQLEIRYSKSELLEMYFNLAPYGGNIEGVGAAALFYFDKEPSGLTWSEATLLTAIPGSPEKFRPDKCLECGTKRSEILLGRLRDWGIITSAEYEDALAEEIPSQRLSIPRLAPHLSESLRSAHPDSSQLRSTIRFEMQEMCERLSSAYHNKYAVKDIYNLAIVVIDNESSEIIASVGSPDFNDNRHSGQVDATNSPRSPGSALKPFVYALAFDLGTLSPEIMVADIPVDYGGYRPVNYDETYRGVISVREALIHSLNIPAVNAASKVGLSNLFHVLRRGGLTTLERPYYEYGLPLILGAAEVRLTELTNLYSALARKGIYRKANRLLNEDNSNELILFSPQATYLIADILVDLRRPDLPDSWRAATGQFPVAWKTGTSYGRRDAWSIGYTPKYTVGVWAGNSSGEGSNDLVGATVAAPILFDVFSEIVKTPNRHWFEQPSGVSERNVCVVSGQPAGKFCKETTPEIFMIGISPNSICTIHRPILVDRSTGLRLRASCTSEREYDRKVVEIWPPRVATWLTNNDMAASLPPYDPTCLSIATGLNPSIISPEQGAVFRLLGELPAKYQKIRLQASVASGDGTLHWFLDGVHFAEAEAREVTFYIPTKGKHTLLCVDDAGRSASSRFDVE